MNDSDPITDLGTNGGCHACGKETDNFYFFQYYMLPRKLVRKRHRDKERYTLLCPSCYEESDVLVVFVTGSPLALSKTGIYNLNNMKCAICHDDISDIKVYGVISLLHMAGGSGIESKPLAVFCTDCTDHYDVEF